MSKHCKIVLQKRQLRDYTWWLNLHLLRLRYATFFDDLDNIIWICAASVVALVTIPVGIYVIVRHVCMGRRPLCRRRYVNTTIRL